MNTIQRLLSNTILALLSTAMMKVSTSVLFIFVGRLLGPSEAGVFNLGVTYYTILVALSTWGLHELLVREVAPRRDESGRYLVNYVALRLAISVGLFVSLLLFLQLNLPYSEEAKAVIRIMSLAVFTEAVFDLCQSIFIAHEQLAVPTLGALINSAVTIGLGLYLLYTTQSATAVAWFMPISSLAGLVVFPFALWRLFRRVPQSQPSRLSWRFSREQLRYTPGFVLLGIFSTLNFQADTFIISFMLSEADLGYYGAAQTVLAGALMIPAAIRTALYPLMARYKREDGAKLAQLYRKSSQYLLTIGLPVAMGITLLADSIITLLFGPEFAPAVPALQWTIWSVVIVVLTVPGARLMLVYNRQAQASWMRGIGMVASIGFNLLLIPAFGIVGAGIARVLASLVFLVLIYGYVQIKIMRDDLLGGALRLALATLIMAAAVWPIRDMFFVIPVLVGALVYGVAIVLLGAVTAEDRYYLQQLFRARVARA